MLTVIVDNDTEVEDATSNEASRNVKPWGEIRHFCPVALKESNVLWPGNNETLLRLEVSICLDSFNDVIVIRYREKLYSFSSDESREKFMLDPSSYSVTPNQFEVRHSIIHYG